MSARTTRSDFARLITYVCRKAVAVKMRNALGDLPDVVEDMWLTAECSRCKTKTLHFVISWPETERPTPAQAIKAMEMMLTDIGLEDHQAVIGVHDDTNKLHVHAGVNGINPLTHIQWRSSNSYARIELACRKIELTQGWSQDRGRFDIEVGEDADGPAVKLVPKPGSHWDEKTKRRAAGRAASQRDVETERRTGMPPLCDALSDLWKARIAAVLDGAKDWAAVHAGLRAIGLAYARKGSGAQIRIIGSDTAMTASQLAGRFALGKMQKRLGPFMDAPADVVTTPAAFPADRPNGLRGRRADDAAELTKSQTFKATLLARSYIGITLHADVVRAIKRVDLDGVPPRITLTDGGVIVDEGAALSGSDGGDTMSQARLMVAMAKAKGWSECEAEGSPTFLRAIALAAAEAGLVVSGVPEDIMSDVATARAALSGAQDGAWGSDSMTHPAVTGPGHAHAAADAARAAAAEARAVDRAMRQALAAKQEKQRAELAALLADETGPLAQTMARGLDLHHRDMRNKQRKNRPRTLPAQPVQLATDDRRRRAAWQVLMGQVASTATDTHIGYDGDVDAIPRLDHTVCRQLWAAADTLALQTTGMDARAINEATRMDPARDMRVLADSTILFAHRDAADNILGFEVTRQMADGTFHSAFAAGGRQAGLTLGDPTIGELLVVTDWGIEAKLLQASSEPGAALYLSLGGTLDAYSLTQLHTLAAGRTVGFSVRDETLAEALLAAIPGATRLVIPAHSAREVDVQGGADVTSPGSADQDKPESNKVPDGVGGGERAGVDDGDATDHVILPRHDDDGEDGPIHGL